MRLYIEGHNHKRGYVVSRTWSIAECSTLPPTTDDEIRPVRQFATRPRAERFIARYNRRFATH
jgi:hypothetical protein